MEPTPTVLFVCLHGSAKSVIAGRCLERLAAERGLRITCMSAGVEPDPAFPAHVLEGLRSDGLAAPAGQPRQATIVLVAHADHVVSFGCDLNALASRPDVIRWDDVPAVSDGYGPARDEIAKRARQLLERIVSGSQVE